MTGADDHVNFYGTCFFGIDAGSAAKAADRCASPDGRGKVTKMTRFVPLLSRSP